MGVGRISTFYSYKGGAGRSFALANVAVLLARWGHRVLCIDWDLEAPGLDLYFKVQNPAVDGLLDFLASISNSQTLAWQGCVTRNVCTDNILGSIDLIAAGDGKDHQGYLQKLEALDWDLLYTEHDLGSRIESLRTEWCKEYDFVLIDSRTGITDPGAICTVQLPDTLFMVLTANQQSLSGISDVANRAERARRRLPFERQKLNIVPVLSRFDSTEEYDIANQWKARMADGLRPFFGTWLNARIPVERALDLCTIPYVSKWSFGEELAVLTETRRSPHFVSYTLENLASLMSLGFDRTDQFGESPDSYVDLAKREAKRKASSAKSDFGFSQTSPFVYDCFLSYPNDLEMQATSIGKGLADQGWRIFLNHNMSSGESWPKRINETLENSQHFILFVGQSLSSFQTEEAYSFLKQVTEERSARAIIPVLIGPSQPVFPSLPSILANTQMIDGRALPADQTVALIDEQLRRLSPQLA